METQPSHSSSTTRGGASRTRRDDWQAAGLIDRMLAYRDWWNIPEGRGRSGAARNRSRPAERAR